MKNKNKIYLFFEMWATVAILGNGPATPWFRCPVSSTNSCQMGNGSKWLRSELNVHRGNGMARYGNNGRKVYGVTESKWKKVFWGRSSQCIYRMVRGFLTHGILFSIVSIYGF